jgi:tripartite-type tricarboxylate transporter receptor subunit TctC
MLALDRIVSWLFDAACVTWVLAAAALTLSQAPSARADDYPSRNVTIVAPAAPGGLYSLFARLIGSKLEQRFGRTFVVENRPGASSIIGILSVIHAPHDGYTLIVANNTGMAVNVTTQKHLPYDPQKDLAPVALIARIPEVLVVDAALPVRSLGDLAELAKKTPGGLSFGSPGAGTGSHLSGVLLGSVLDIPLTHVPYKGMSPAINDVAGGHIAFMFSPVPVALPLVQAGRVRALGVTTSERVEALPDVPPLIELGLRGFDAVSWFMLVAPAGTSDDVVDRLYRESRAAVDDPGTRAELLNLGLLPVQSPPPAELKRFVAAEIARWGEIATKAGLAGAQ